MFKEKIAERKKSALRGVAMILVLVISFAAWILISRGPNIAYGKTVSSYSYLIIKGAIVTAVCAGVFFLVKRFGVQSYRRFSGLILYVGAIVIAAMSALENVLASVNLPVITQFISYAYAAFPVLQIIVLCAWTASLSELFRKGSVLAKVSCLVAFAALTSTALKDYLFLLAALILTVWGVFRFGAKARRSALVFKILLIVFCLLIFAVLVSGMVASIRSLARDFTDPQHMSWIARDVITHAKWFGTMDNLSSVPGGNLSYYGPLWLMELIGIVPALLVLCALIALFAVISLRRPLQPVQTVAAVYLVIHVVFALLPNCGITLVSFTTPFPALRDSTAGMLILSWLLGLAASRRK